MNFPELPKGYRWRVVPLIPTYGAPEPQVRVEIRSRWTWIESLWSCSPGYRIYVTNPDTQSVRAAAIKLHDRFMTQQGNPGNAQVWEDALNAGAMK